MGNASVGSCGAAIAGSPSHVASHTAMCRMCAMATNLAIEGHLLEEALRIGGQRTKKATVTEALQEYIQRRKQKTIVELFNTVEYDPKYNYKKQRRKK